ncbi:transcription factor HHO3-like [Andrographis paniculata]|uniref:transcription factor HHO3-like n=1 Tax=Andrographis paniculata TaxID=175694 RepID=UPI0021E8F8E4|nr:transcription factor HHO3-like [Andrographis paniculata]
MKKKKCEDYVKALEAERSKIQDCESELSFSLELLTQAIEACKLQQLSGTTAEHNLLKQLVDCNWEQKCRDAPVLEEFIAIKRAVCGSDSEDEEHDDSKKPRNDDTNISQNIGKKADWLRSVQLWNQGQPDPQGSPKRVTVLEAKKINGGSGGASTSSAAESGSADKKGSGKEGQLHARKVRRRWSPEMHNKFLQAIQQLGGSEAATPTQNRKIMNVYGLTHDEVKSHLQHYRLQTRRRRPNPSIHCTAMATAAGTTTTTSAQETAAATTTTTTYTSAVPLSIPEASTSSKQETKLTNSGDRGSSGAGEHSFTPIL